MRFLALFDTSEGVHFKGMQNVPYSHVGRGEAVNATLGSFVPVREVERANQFDVLNGQRIGVYSSYQLRFRTTF